MLKTFFSGLEWDRHRHQMGLAAGVERGGGGGGEEEPEREREAARETWLKGKQSVKELQLSSSRGLSPNRLYCDN